MLLFVTWLASCVLAPAWAGPPPDELLPDGIERPCDTPNTWAVVDPEPLPWTGPGIELAHRDPYGAPHVFVTEHFAIRYGDEGHVDEAQIQRLGSALERSWVVQVDEMGHRPPRGTDQAFFNVYIGDSDPYVPSAGRAAGYYTSDRQGWPMIVVGAHTLADGDYADITAAHELYHAVQGATDRYDYRRDSAGSWFWEASATWASSEVFPDNPGYSAFLGAYAFLPHHRVDFFRFPESGDMPEYYQYGAFVFLEHLVASTGSTDVVRDAWLDAGDEPSPVEVMRQALDERGFDLDALWLEHVARNATWDYPKQDLYLAWIRRWSQIFPGEDTQIAGWLDREGTGTWWSPPLPLRPHRYGANVLAMKAPMHGNYRFEVLGQPFGDHGRASGYGATLVLDRGAGDVEYRRLTFEAHHGSIEAADLADVQTAYLVVGAWTHESVPLLAGETFPYEVMVSFVPSVFPRPLDPARMPEPSDVACDSAAGGGGLGWLLASLALVGLRRRR